ncbi:MAG: YaiI/YqxD family protein [Magnetospirillum sp.]|nr:YaiI/YqxD family protein [Magnetospirillum sp.]
MTTILIDGDACPVKDEAIRVAERHQLPVLIVANRWHRIDHYLVSQVVAQQGADAADDIIADKAQAGDVVVTADIPLAQRCLAKGARPIDPRGRPFEEANIGMQMAMRDLMKTLRETGEVTGGPAGFTKQDRSRFLDGLEKAVQAARRSKV